MAGAESYRSPKTEVRENSKIGGKGVFAKELIKKGEIVAIKGGHVFDSKDHNNIDEEARHYCLQIENSVH